jgi:protein-tyrosine-phosphatase
MVRKVHFICRGNSFRSRIAEAYLKSLKLPDIDVSSSGTVAKLNYSINDSLPDYTTGVLKAHDLLAYDKGHWDQLTVNRISESDITIFMGQLPYQEALADKMTPEHFMIWNIPDAGESFEGKTTPLPDDPNIYVFAEETYQRIKKMIDDKLLVELK